MSVELQEIHGLLANSSDEEKQVLDVPPVKPSASLLRRALRWRITKEQIIKTVVLFFVLIGTALFAFSAEEDELVLDLEGLSSSFPIYYPFEVTESRTVLEALVRVQDVPGSGQYPFPNPTKIYISVQGSRGEERWAPIDGIWVVEAKVESESEQLLHDFYLDDVHKFEGFRWSITTNSETPLGITLRFRELWEVVRYEVLIAAFILIGVYALIVFELLHRTIAAMLGSFVCLSVVSAVHGRPTFDRVVNWIDFDTVGLLFGMMIMVGIFSETGFFEWSAIKAYKVSKGNVWRLTLILCIFTAVLSAFLDNVTTVLLMSPVTIRLCRVLDIDPKPIIISLVMMSNIGGTATAIGDPPNIIIVNAPAIASNPDISFVAFSLHMVPGVLLASVVTMTFIYFVHRKSFHREAHSELAREIEIWKHTLQHAHGDLEEERKVRAQMADFIRDLEVQQRYASEVSRLADIAELEALYQIKDKALLFASITVLSGAIAMFFLHTWIQQVVDLSLAWIAVIGAMILILLRGSHDMEIILEKIEWATLIFFAGLFVLMHGLGLLGLIDWIGDRVYDVISLVPADALGGKAQLAVAIILILWVSAIVSAFIDNIPYTTAMVPVIVTLVESDLALPMAPLVYALAFGTCFGGNGTLIGASANVVAVGLAEQQKYPISFMAFFKTGFPVLILSVFTATVYLLLTHVLISWY